MTHAQLIGHPTDLKGHTNLVFLFRANYVLSSRQITQTGRGGISAPPLLLAFIHWLDIQLHDVISSQQCNLLQLELQTKGLHPWATLHIRLLWVHVNIVLRLQLHQPSHYSTPYVSMATTTYTKWRYQLGIQWQPYLYHTFINSER